MVRKHPDVEEKEKGLDVSDLTSDPFLLFQRKYQTIEVNPRHFFTDIFRRYYMPLGFLFSYIIPTIVPICWGESMYVAFTSALFRQTLVYNGSFCANSVAHLWGPRPYDANANSRQSVFVYLLKVF